MLVDTLTNPDLQVQGISSQTFQIETNAITFQLLTSNLYKNPIGSIIRELTSNAWDAHVEAGTTDIPIEVLSPTSLNPELIIKDYGTGLSKDAVFEVYTVLFRSTRRESNDFLGGKGLGSKTPFSYSDTFIVESRYQGVLYTYSMFLNEERIPSVTLLNEAPTDERNGLTIRIPVTQSDHYRFSSEICKQLTLFPKIKTNAIIPKAEKIYENAHGAFSKKLEESFYIQIGNILYEIEYKLLQIPDGVFVKYFYGYIQNASLILNGEIGAVDITPNREDLNYTDKTKRVIRHLILKFKIAFVEDLVRDLNAAPSLVEARKTCLHRVLLLNALGWVIKTDDIKWPLSQLSPLVELPTDPRITKCGTIIRRRKYDINWHNNALIKFDITKPLHIYYTEPTTKHLKDLIKQEAPILSDKTCLMLTTTMSAEEIIELYEPLLTQPIASITYLEPFPSPIKTKGSRSRSVGAFAYKTVNGVFNQELTDSYHYVKASEYERYKDLLCYICRDCYNTIYIIPDHHTRRHDAGTHYFPTFEQEFKTLLKHYKKDVYTLHAFQESWKADYAINYALSTMFQSLGLHKGINSPLIDLLKKTNPSTLVHNLLDTAIMMGVPIDSSKEREELDTLIDRYKPLINIVLNIREYPTILIAFDTYLENI